MTIKNVLLLIFVAVLSGCSPQQVQVTELQLYDGPERPIQDLAMIILPANHYLVSLDGKNTEQHRQHGKLDNPSYLLPEQGKLGNAFYLLPGGHRIKVFYAKGETEYSQSFVTYTSAYGYPLPLTGQFEAGHVYCCFSSFEPGWQAHNIRLNEDWEDRRPDIWEAKILHEGTYERFITQQIGESHVFNRKIENMPQRWKDFLLMQVLSVREYTCLAPTLPRPAIPLPPNLVPTDPIDLCSDSPEKQSPEWPFLRQLLARGNQYLDEISAGDYESAINKLTDCLKTKKSNANIYIDRGVAYARKKMFNDAIDDFTKAIELRPDYALSLAYYNRGLTNYKMNKYRLAKKDFLQTIKLDPMHIISDHAKAIIQVMPDN